MAHAVEQHAVAGPHGALELDSVLAHLQGGQKKKAPPLHERSRGRYAVVRYGGSSAAAPCTSTHNGILTVGCLQHCNPIAIQQHQQAEPRGRLQGRQAWPDAEVVTRHGPTRAPAVTSQTGAEPPGGTASPRAARQRRSWAVGGHRDVSWAPGFDSDTTRWVRCHTITRPQSRRQWGA